MKKLIVNNTENAPMEIVARILVTWSKLAALVQEKATLVKGCELEWELMLQHVSRGTGWSVEEGVDFWDAFGAVRMVFRVRVAGAMAEQRFVNVPLTEVEDIAIADDGTFSWHGGYGKEPENHLGKVAQIAEAVSKGKLLLENGIHYYRKNRIPILGSEQ